MTNIIDKYEYELFLGLNDDLDIYWYVRAINLEEAIFIALKELKEELGDQAIIVKWVRLLVYDYKE